MEVGGGRSPLAAGKRAVVRLIGRRRADILSRPYHDWLARRRSRDFVSALAPTGNALNLGCGHRPLVGWVNLDVKRVPGAQVVWDLRRGLPFPDGSAEVIFAEHVIEHLSRDDGLRLLCECQRVLADGGVLRLSTPDLGKYLRSYCTDRAFLRSSPVPPGLVTASDIVNRAMRDHGHLWSYDEELLRLLLEQAGFREVTRESFGISSHKRMNGIDLAEREEESIYVEAAKSGGVPGPG